jgi:hypothetical protein
MNDDELRRRLTLLADRVPARPDAAIRVRTTVRRRRRHNGVAAGLAAVIAAAAVVVPAVLAHRAPARVEGSTGPTPVPVPTVSATCTRGLSKALTDYGTVQHFYAVRASAAVAASFAQNVHVSGDPVDFCLAVGDLDNLAVSTPPGVPDQMHYALMAAGTGAPQLVYASANRPLQPLPGIDPAAIAVYQPTGAALPTAVSAAAPTAPAAAASSSPTGTPDDGKPLNPMYRALPVTKAPVRITATAAELSLPWLLARRKGDRIEVVYAAGAGDCVVPVGYQVTYGKGRVELAFISRAVVQDGQGCATVEPIHRTVLTLTRSEGLTLLHSPVSPAWRKQLPNPAS